MRIRKWISDLTLAAICLGAAIVPGGRSGCLWAETEVRCFGERAGGADSDASLARVIDSYEEEPSPQEQERGNSPAPVASSGPSAGTPGPPPATTVQSAQPDPNDYIIGEQDALMITVWKEREISGGVVVRPDGKITVPRVGEIKVVGMTPVQLQNLLAERRNPLSPCRRLRSR